MGEQEDERRSVSLKVWRAFSQTEEFENNEAAPGNHIQGCEEKIRRGDEEQVGGRSRADLELQESKMARYFPCLTPAINRSFLEFNKICHP